MTSCQVHCPAFGENNALQLSPSGGTNPPGKFDVSLCLHLLARPDSGSYYLDCKSLLTGFCISIRSVCLLSLSLKDLSVGHYSFFYIERGRCFPHSQGFFSSHACVRASMCVHVCVCVCIRVRAHTLSLVVLSHSVCVCCVWIRPLALKHHK